MGDDAAATLRHAMHLADLHFASLAHPSGTNNLAGQQCSLTANTHND